MAFLYGYGQNRNQCPLRRMRLKAERKARICGWSIPSGPKARLELNANRHKSKRGKSCGWRGINVGIARHLQLNPVN